MAERLALEVSSHIESKEEQQKVSPCPLPVPLTRLPRPINPAQVERLSFVAFSIGGVVLRAALLKPSLRRYVGMLHTLLALSCPLLGLLLPHTSTLVKGGLWFFTTVTGDQALKELCHGSGKDKSSPVGESYLSRLNSPG
ncbi:MAG: hypothetical protein SGPRY_011345, partial [Prymnesium sp.]